MDGSCVLRVGEDPPDQTPCHTKLLSVTRRKVAKMRTLGLPAPPSRLRQRQQRLGCLRFHTPTGTHACSGRSRALQREGASLPGLPRETAGGGGPSRYVAPLRHWYAIKLSDNLSPWFCRRPLHGCSSGAPLRRRSTTREERGVVPSRSDRCRWAGSMRTSWRTSWCTVR